MFCLNEKDFPDNNLRIALTEILDRVCDKIFADVPNYQIFKGNVIFPEGLIFYIKYLDLKSKGIKSIKGLEYFRNLEELYLDNNEIKDISYLADLHNLYCLRLSYNKIKNIKSLKNLKKIVNLDLGNNKITDISSLKGWSTNSPFCLTLKNNPIKNLDILRTFKSLITLNINGIDIKDCSFLRNLDLYDLYIYGQSYQGKEKVREALKELLPIN